MGEKRMGLFQCLGILVACHLLALSLAKADGSFQGKSCQELEKELRSMQMAQHQLFKSYEQKNESIASTMDLHAKSLIEAQKRNGKIKKSDLTGLKRSAQLLRSHQSKETELVERFEKASALLLDQVQVCLEKSTEVSSHNTVADSSQKN